MTGLRLIGGVLLVLCITVGSAFAADEKLPAPVKSGGKGVFSALADRSSSPQSSFPTGAVSRQELSTILWAASGLNRPERGWTVPMAMGREPYCRVYVIERGGSFLYDWRNHALKSVGNGALKQKITSQSFVTNAPLILVFVSDSSLLSSLNAQRRDEWASVLTGGMTQNIYLASDALGIGSRYIASFDESVVRKELSLPEQDKPIAIMPLGK